MISFCSVQPKIEILCVWGYTFVCYLQKSLCVKKLIASVVSYAKFVANKS